MSQLAGTQDALEVDFDLLETETSTCQDQIWGRLLSAKGKIRPQDLIEEEYTFGRADECHVNFHASDIGDKLIYAISKVHFRLKRVNSATGAHVLLEDLSSNGTFVNGELVGKGKKRVLCNNDEIALAVKKCFVYVFVDLKGAEDNNVPEIVRNKYILSKILGTGACGEVRLAFRKSNCERVAIKIISKRKFTINGVHQVERIDQQNQVLNEVELLKRMDHPCIIRIEEVIDTAESIYMVMEIIEGGELFDRIANNGKLSEDEAKLLFYQMVLAVLYLHESGVVHRDLKPENILLCSDEKETLVKVTDFGLSKFIDGSMMMKTFCGTPNYLAPEVLKSQGNDIYTNQIDCWSLGVILYICLAGYPPFSADYKDMPLRQQILKGRLNFDSKYWSGVSEEAKDMVRKLLTVNPSTRMTLDQALQHSWLKDKKMREKVDKLMAVKDTPPASPESNRKRHLDDSSDDSFNVPALKRIHLDSTASPSSC